MARPTLYLETTIPSYLASRPNRDVVVLAHQQITAEWWAKRRDDFDLRVSKPVLLDAGRGDAEAARARLASPRLASPSRPSLKLPVLTVGCPLRHRALALLGASQ
jgi:hypothetical protein